MCSLCRSDSSPVLLELAQLLPRSTSDSSSSYESVTTFLLLIAPCPFAFFRIPHECCFHLNHFFFQKTISHISCHCDPAGSTLKWGSYSVGALRLQSIMADKTWWKHLSVVASGQMELLDYTFLDGGRWDKKWDLKTCHLADSLLPARLYFPKITKPSQTALPPWD